MPKKLLSPGGSIVCGISGYAFAAEDVMVGDDGTIAGDGFGDMLDTTHWRYGAQRLLTDRDGSEYLEQHCRVVEVAEDFDDWPDNPIEPWPDDIWRMCAQAAWYAGGALMIEKALSWCPIEMREDPTVTAVVENILLGRANGMVESLNAQIAAWRKDNPDITTLIEDTDDAEA